MVRRAKKRKDGAAELLENCEVVPKELMAMADRLREFSRPYLDLLYEKRQRPHGEDYLRGLLSDLERKSVEPITERLGQYRRPLQYFIGGSEWDHAPLLDFLNQEVARELGEPNGILVADPSAMPKKGKASVGVGRQWCGRLGKVENCQLGVYLGYVSNKGHTLVDEELYLPREWTSDKARREKCNIPRGLRFKTAHKLTLEMLGRRRDILPHRWFVADDEFGRPAGFRNKLHKMGERYLLEIPSNLLVRDINAKPPARIAGRRGGRRKVPFVQARAWMASLKQEDWQLFDIRPGSKGPVKVWAARTRVQTKDRQRCSERIEWLVVIRTEEKTPEYRYYFSNAEENVALGEMVHAASARHWIEDCFERAKGKVGLDHYEVRSWQGWHHHMTLAMLALFFLVLEQRRLSESTPVITVQQTAEAIGEIFRDPDMDLRELAQRLTNRLRRNEQTRIDHWRKFHQLPPSWIIARSSHVPSFAQ
jgi:SRSO17 transposase